jgi:transposase
MFFRATTRRRGDKVYQSLHLVESYRSKEGKVRQRILVNFGAVHKFTPAQVEEMIQGLKKFFQLETPAPEVAPPAASQDFGATYAIFRLWEQLGWTRVFHHYLRKRRHDFDVVCNLKVMVANRLLDPLAKLHILDWMEGVYFPGLDRDQVDYNHLLRTLDFLISHKEELEPQLARPILTLFDNSLDLVFYDLTSCYFEIDQQDKNQPAGSQPARSTLRNRGYDRDRSGCPQVVLGLVMTKDGIPLCHHVFPGETPDKATLQKVVQDLKARFPIQRCIVVGDRGLLSEDNLQALAAAQLDFIVSRPLRRNLTAQKVLSALAPQIKAQITHWHQAQTPLDKRQAFFEVTLEGRRFVAAHQEDIAQQTKKSCQRKLIKATSYITERIARTVLQQKGSLPVKGRALNHQETLLHVHAYLRDRQLLRYYRLRLDEQGAVECLPHEENRQWELAIDGKLLLETTNHTLSPWEIVRQYKELQDIERCFRTLKSSLDIRPVYHWVDRRIAAHIFMCVMALQLQRVMRHRLRTAKIDTSPERVLEKLSFQRTVEANINGQTVQGLVSPTPVQLELFAALEMPAPQPKNLLDPSA